MPGVFNLTGHGANVVGSLGSGSLVQNMPSAMEFNGAGTHASSSATYTGLDATDNFTVAWWMKRGSNQNGRVINVDSAASELFYARIDGTGDASDLEVFVDAATDGYVGAGTAGDFARDGTEWQHYAIVYDTAVLRMYRNGINIVNDSGINGDTANSNGPLYMGGYHHHTDHSPYFSGSLRDMRIFTSGLTATQVTSVFEDTAMGGIGVTPVNWYYMEEGTGATLNDSGSANIDLGIVSGSWDASMYNLNQIGSGSVSGATTISGGTWNLRDSTYMSFDGVDNYIDSNTNLSTILTGSHTISTWCKLTDGHPTSTESLWGSRNSPLDDSCECYISTTGKITYWYMAGGVDEYAGSDAAVFVDNATGWHHVVATMEYIDSSNATMKLYFDGEEVALGSSDGGFAGNMANWSSSIDMAFGASNNNNIPERFLDGKMRDFKIYDSALTSSQIDLLYKGQWVGSPKHWWKLNDGSGDTIVDSGQAGTNGTNNDATWVNPDFTIGGNDTSHELGLSNESTLSAPLGNLFFASGGNYDNYGTFTHNSGTVVVDTNGGTVRVNLQTLSTPSPFIFYDLIVSGSGNGYILGGDCKAETVENSLHTMANTYLAVTDGGGHSDSTLTMGTSTAGGSITIDSGKELYFYNYAAPHLTYLYGACDYDYTDITKTGNIDVGHTGVTHLKNINIIGDWDIGSDSSGVGHNVTLDGDCEFDAVTVGDGDYFVCDSGDLTTSDTLTVEGTFSGGTGLHNINNINGNFSTTDLTLSSGITYLNGGGSSALSLTSAMSNLSFASGTLVFNQSDGNQRFEFNKAPGSNAKRMGTVVFNNGPSNYSYIGAVGWSAYRAPHDDVIILSNDNSTGFLTQNLDMGMDGSLKIAADAKINAGSSTLTMGENFNMAGGFIGKGAYSGDGVNDNFMQIWNGDISDFEMGTGPLTVEAWVKGTAIGGLIGSYWGSDLPMYQLDVGDGTDTSMRILATGAGGASTDGLTQVNAKATTNVIDGKWHNVVGVRDTSAGLVKLYIDGKLENESSDAATVAEGGNTNNAQRKNVGSRGYYGELDGEIARASYWKVALTESEIRGMMFQDWSTMAAADVIDDSKCVAWYEFSDTQSATAVTDMTGSGNTGALTSTDLWAGPGTFTYGTSTLKFDKAGTCNLYGEQDGTTTQLNALTITNGTTLETYCRDNDFEIFGTITNSGTLNSNRNWQYKSSNMPIIGASSDLTVGNNYFYYFPQGVGATASGAATTYYILATAGGALTMQGDFTTTSHCYPYSDSEIYFNGYKGTLDNIRCAGSGNIVLDPGSGINFTNTRGFKQNDGGAESYITTNGEAALQIRAGEQPDSGCLIAGNGTAYPAGTSPVLTTGNSISMWVNPKNFDNWYGFFGFGSNKAYMNMTNGNERQAMSGECNLDDDTITLNAGENIFTAGTWTHVGWVWNTDKTWSLYIDGVLKDTSSATTDDELNVSYFGRGYGETTDWDGSIADVRLFRSALTAGNMVTLAAINPATNVSGTYADPDNAIDASGWWKLGADAVGAADLTNYGTFGSDYNGSTDGAKKSGFVTISGTAGFGALNNPFQDMTLTNTYVSGMADIVVGETSQGANTDSTLITKGTVVLD